MTDTKDALSQTVSRRRFLSIAALAGVGVAGGSSLLAACGAGSSGGPGGAGGGGGGGASGEATGPIVWASWANPGEGERFKAFSKNYTEQHGNPVTWQQVVGDYQSKLLTQLAGGSAPDAFYVGDGNMAKFIESGQLEDLTSFLETPESPVKATDTYPGLIKWCKPVGGEGLFGIPVDCNPKIFWFNQDMLGAAGVTTNPAALFEGGSWNQAALDDLLNKVKGTGKRGMVVQANWFDFTSIVTTFGGTAFDEESGDCVWDKDEKAMAALTWLFDHFKNETITYGGSLPKGQGVDALFYGQQLATCQWGRWILPNLKKLKFGYDIAPMPSEDGKTIMPAAVYTAAMSVNTKAQDKQAALMFLGRYVNIDGQRFRLSGGGNAVPSIAGLPEVVTEGGVPAHASYFEEAAKVGYAIPLKIASNATVATNLETTIDKIIKGGADAQTFATQTAAFINSGGKS
jgi:multiple sugar transport system substrate-binding protein